MLRHIPISASDPIGARQLKQRLNEMVDEINRLQVRGDGATTAISGGNTVVALRQPSDWAMPYLAESGASYAAGLYHAKVWVRPHDLGPVLAGSTPSFSDAWVRFPDPAPTTLTGLVAFRASPQREDVSAAQDGSNLDTVWVVDPLAPWGSGSYVAVIQDGGLVRLDAPATGTYFLGTVDGQIALVEAGSCDETTTTTTTGA